jgi:hypothetical protein
MRVALVLLIVLLFTACMCREANPTDCKPTIASQAFAPGGQDYYLLNVKMPPKCWMGEKDKRPRDVKGLVTMEPELRIDGRILPLDVEQKGDLFELKCDLRTLKGGSHDLVIEFTDQDKKLPTEQLEAHVVKEARLEFSRRGLAFKCPKDKCKGEFDSDYNVLRVEAEVGTVVTLGGARETVAADAYTGNHANVVAQGTPPAATDKIEASKTGLPISIKLPDGTTIHDELKLSASTMIQLTADTVIGKGLRFGPGDEDGGKPDTLVLAGDTTKVWGKGTTWGDVDLVASVKWTVRTKSCGDYRGSGGATRRITNEARDALITVYNRRTGKEVGSKNLTVTMPACVKSISGTYSGVEKRADLAEAYSYLQSLIQ